ncbi:hypothetical protein HBI88_234830 [Parastagonospora nodorum]|nr:hypothetical protein HBH43_239750 [Parastagonospora nodorum]KAH5432485.1 hypothetical protein HBI47_097840 [Parastagonospora nodorum]KAH5487167.1 hypothetical protein HBI52_239300 [Parastagonospora nodorum]KAH5783721.1 hypothetical protein HBI96_241430 [Parastagonospora nodorum]KAH5791184.1 hypothetical protein HBI97_043680 [Parastagonospora nodorum]
MTLSTAPKVTSHVDLTAQFPNSLVSEHTVEIAPPCMLIVSLAHDLPVGIPNATFTNPNEGIAAYMKRSTLAQAKLIIPHTLFTKPEMRYPQIAKGKDCTSGTCYLITYSVENDLDDCITTWNHKLNPPEKYTTLGGGGRSCSDPNTDE